MSKLLRALRLTALLTGLVVVFVVGVQLIASSPVHAFNIFSAGGSQSVCTANPTPTVCEAGNKNQGILGNGGVLDDVLLLFVYLVAIVSVIMLVIGGLRYILSGGDAGGIQSAKNTIIYGLVGLAIAIFGAAIVYFVLGFF